MQWDQGQWGRWGRRTGKEMGHLRQAFLAGNAAQPRAHSPSPSKLWHPGQISGVREKNVGPYESALAAGATEKHLRAGDCLPVGVTVPLNKVSLSFPGCQPWSAVRPCLWCPLSWALAVPSSSHSQTDDQPDGSFGSPKRLSEVQHMLVSQHPCEMWGSVLLLAVKQKSSIICPVTFEFLKFPVPEIELQALGPFYQQLCN